MKEGGIRANIIGAGLAGLSAAITLARRQLPCRLISLLPSERAQSVLAEGGINGALNTMGEDDCPENHFADTMRAGVYIADPEAVRGLADSAPGILLELKKLGAAFNLRDEQIQQRNFGGQKKKRTAYARSSTGKVLMTTLIDEARKYEEAGYIQRYSHHELIDLMFVTAPACASERKIDRIQNTLKVPEADSSMEKETVCCRGAVIRDTYTGEVLTFEGPVILSTGGLNGVFPGVTTGTVTNSGDAAALAFARGVKFSNLEMIQYHPTTIGIAGKRCLVSEAARGEGGRLFIFRNGRPWYFMEERYPEMGNLMPRDVVSREMYFVTHETGIASDEAQVYLDMRHLPKETWERKLPDLRSEVMHYLGLDPAKTPVPVEPGIHYFMGGIDVDARHQTNIPGLYAAGECCSQYHGANRLGGNSTMGAIYGGRVAANCLAESGMEHYVFQQETSSEPEIRPYLRDEGVEDPAGSELIEEIRDILLNAMGIVRYGPELERALQRLRQLSDRSGDHYNFREQNRILLAEAMLRSALYRQESRGAHYRSDYPETSELFCGKTIASLHKENNNGCQITITVWK